jgi:hypothetical protein
LFENVVAIESARAGKRYTNGGWIDMLSRLKRRISRPEGYNISDRAIDKKLVDMARNHDRSECLDVGSGTDKSELFSTLDIRKEFEPDYLGDVRCLFAPGYMERVQEYPDLLRIPENGLMVLKMQHLVEHIEWIYQEFLFEWAMKALAPGGIMYVATPNLAYSVGVYVKNRKRQKRGNDISYPISEHVYLKPGVNYDLQRWLNFKLFSGCSPGDYHYSSFDRLWLYEILILAGFEKISIYDGSTLKAIAYKPGQIQFDVDLAVDRVVNPG